MNLGDFQDFNMKHESPTFNLRWNENLLEQEWAITSINRGRTTGVEHEWRPVPQKSPPESKEQ